MGRVLPRGAIEELCDALECMPAYPTPRQRPALLGAISSPAARATVSRLIGTWELTPHVNPLNIMAVVGGAAEGRRARTVCSDNGPYEILAF